MSTYVWSARRPRAADVGRAASDVVIGAIAAGAVGLLVEKGPFYALVPLVALVAVWLAVRPRPAALVLGASIPATQTIASGHVGLHIGAGDLLLLLLFFAAVGAAVLERDAETFKALGPVRRPVVQYCLFVLILLFAHPGFQPVVQTFQRYELIAFPLVVGSYLVLRGVHLSLLKAYLIGATALALVFPFDALGLQKNPAGQFMANAILLIVGVPALSRYRLLLPLLVYGLFASESRGALLACAAGVALLLAMRLVASPRQALGWGLLVAAVALLAFQLMPRNSQIFVTSYGAQGNSNAAWNVRYRQNYWDEALSITRAHPWLGVGVGSYGSVVPAGPFYTDDPHNVFLLQAAEGGWAFAVSWVVLILGTALALFRLRRIELAPAALAVLLATAGHGLLDVYWVRGTPVLSWLLVGMACALAWQSREAARA